LPELDDLTDVAPVGVDSFFSDGLIDLENYKELIFLPS
jgi:hypothetical protein